MCRLQNIAMRDYQESVTTEQTDAETDRQTPDKVIPMCRNASQAIQKLWYWHNCFSTTDEVPYDNAVKYLTDLPWFDLILLYVTFSDIMDMSATCPNFDLLLGNHAMDS